MLTAFDFAVIAYAQSRGEESEAVYKRLEDGQYRDQQSEAQLLAKLDRLKDKETTHYVLPYGIKVSVNGKSGAIESTLKDGMDAEADAEIVAGIDVLESLVLAHACAGVNVGSDEYVKDLETTVEAIQNLMGESGE